MKITSHRELEVWQEAMDLAMEIFHASKKFPADERFSLTDQIRRSARSASANLSEAWRKRRYEAAFISKLNDAEGEAAGRSFAGAKQTLASKLLQDFRQEVSGNFLLLSDILHHGVFAFVHLCQMDEGANRVFSRPRIDHSLIPPRYSE